MLELLTSIALITSCASTVVHTVISYKKSKEPPRDPIWEAALKIVTSQSGGECNVNEFAKAYRALKMFVDNGHSLNGLFPLDFAVIQEIQDAEEQGRQLCQSQGSPE